jgi:hypothetical protein
VVAVAASRVKGYGSVTDILASYTRRSITASECRGKVTTSLHRHRQTQDLVHVAAIRAGKTQIKPGQTALPNVTERYSTPFGAASDQQEQPVSSTNTLTGEPPLLPHPAAPRPMSEGRPKPGKAAPPQNLGKTPGGEQARKHKTTRRQSKQGLLTTAPLPHQRNIRQTYSH